MLRTPLSRQPRPSRVRKLSLAITVRTTLGGSGMVDAPSSDGTTAFGLPASDIGSPSCRAVRDLDILTSRRPGRGVTIRAEGVPRRSEGLPYFARIWAALRCEQVNASLRTMAARPVTVGLEPEVAQ